MSINIDKEDFRAAIDLYEISQCYPLFFSIGASSTVTYDGEYVSINNAAGDYSAVGNGYGCAGFSGNRGAYYLFAEATVKAVGTDTNAYFFFLEPRKAVYAEYQGFKTDAGAGSHKFEFRHAGNEEEDAIAGQDWTVDHEFKIWHKKGAFEQNSGITAAIATGTAVSHDLLGTPTMVHVTKAETGATDVFVDTVGAATFNINFAGGGNKTFYWEAKYTDTPVCQGWIDNVLKATCNDTTDISFQPLNIYAGEANGVLKTMKVKYPPGLHIGNVG